MVHALLVSSGFSSDIVYNKVREIAKKRGYKRGAVITTAHPKKELAHWSIKTKEQIESLGLEVSFIDFDRGEGIDEDIDLIYVCGGNTFHLLHSIQQSKFNIKSQIESLFNRGGLYIGSSAGAVICGPSIVSAGEVHPDKNDDEVEDLRGFSFTKYHVIPHYDEAFKELVEEFSARHGEIYLLKNGEALYLAEDREVKI